MYIRMHKYYIQNICIKFQYIYIYIILIKKYLNKKNITHYNSGSGTTSETISGSGVTLGSAITFGAAATNNPVS